MILLQQGPQLISGGVVRPRWPFRDVPNGGKRTESVYSDLDQSSYVGCSQGGAVSPDEAGPFNRGQFPGSDCVMSWGNECPSPGSQRGIGWRTTAIPILVYKHNSTEV